MTDAWQDSTAQTWIHHVVSEMVPKLAGSTFAISLVPDDEGDVKFWVELGASIMMDKPIMAIVMGDRLIPAKLVAVADEIVRLPNGIDPIGSKAVGEAIKRMLGET